MQVSLLRAMMIVVAAFEGLWAFVFYIRPNVALGFLGRTVVDPVIARQLPLYIASVALAYAVAATDPRRYSRIVWICVVQRIVELGVAAIDRREHVISQQGFALTIVFEFVALGMLIALLRMRALPPHAPVVPDTRDRGLIRLLRGFGCLELFWFFASTLFVQIGARLLSYKQLDPYTTQQQGIALLIIGLASLVTASDLSRYRIFVWIPVFSQLVGIANSFNEIRLGSIGWTGAAIQWSIEGAIVFAFYWFSRAYLRMRAVART